MATPEGSRQAKALLQPGSSNKGQAIHLTEQFSPLGRQAAPDRQLPLLQVGVGLALIPPALSPGQGCVAAAQPHLAPQQGTIELDDFRSRLAVIIESSGVQLFEVPVRTILTLKHRKEVQILSRKGWGTRQFTEYPFQPGEVIKVIRPGYRVGEGEYAVILRKVEVLIRGVDE